MKDIKEQVLFVDQLNKRAVNAVTQFVKSAIRREAMHYVTLSEAYAAYIQFNKWREYSPDYEQRMLYLTKSEFLAYFRYVMADTFGTTDIIKDNSIAWDNTTFVPKTEIPGYPFSKN